jgi:hypothetical protein
MKTIFPILAFSFLAPFCHAQVFSVDHMLSLLSASPSRFDNQLADKGFAPAGKAVQKDTALRMYDYRRTKNFKKTDSVSRAITRADMTDGAFIRYETTSSLEFSNLKTQLRNEGFYCNGAESADNTSPLLFQKKDLCARAYVKTADSLNWYIVQVQKKVFPRSKDIYYANDLLTFTSHEYLVYYFGEENVKKDIYFLAGNEIAKCSVLFLNTKRQVVFIWGDEENRCDISSILLGGQLNLQSSVETGKYVAENNWMLKSGVRPGMSLLQLRMLNGNDFSFYGGNSVNSGAVLPENSGKLNFKKEEVILGCLNCNDEKFGTAKVVKADDSLEDGRILFVLSIIINPSLN